jgi:2-keto-4-pentenoate hydratase/2-oxohepta-3-ene-1,7-dioic acid hydratase in catechol pathway
MVRLASIEHRGKRKLAAQLPDGAGYCDLSSISPNARSFLQAGPMALARADELLVSNKSNPGETLHIPSVECRLLAPIDGSLVGKFLCIGMNYTDHCLEQNVPIPSEPVVFSKFGSCVVGPADPVAKDETTSKLDYEVELGVVIGSVVPRHTKKEDAMEYVGGFTVVHDVSARDWQLEKNGGQWLLGKCVDGYAPIGPVIVTRDDLGFGKAHAVGIRCRVNGETLQDSNTSNLIHKVDELVAFLSKFMTLYPGDIISTGTPPGYVKSCVWDSKAQSRIYFLTSN